MMPGEKNLDVLLRTLSPTLHQGSFVFCQVDQFQTPWLDDAVVIVREEEGTTLVLPTSSAEKFGLFNGSEMAWITLTVNSSLEAIGLTAAFSNALAEKGISCNVIAGYSHDHIFVPVKDATNAMQALIDLQKKHAA